MLLNNNKISTQKYFTYNTLVPKYSHLHKINTYLVLVAVVKHRFFFGLRLAESGVSNIYIYGSNKEEFNITKNTHL